MLIKDIFFIGKKMKGQIILRPNEYLHMSSTENGQQTLKKGIQSTL